MAVEGAWVVLGLGAMGLAWWLPQLWWDLAAVRYASQDREDDAVRTLRRLTGWPGRRQPHDWLRLGILHLQRCELDEGIRALDEAARLGSNDPGVARTRAVAGFLRSGDVEDAVAQLREVTHTPDDQWRSPLYAASLYLDAGRPQEAYEAANEAMRVAAPHDPATLGDHLDRLHALTVAARCAAVAGHADEARRYLAQADDTDGQLPPRVRVSAATAAAQVAACDGRPDDALRVLGDVAADLDGIRGGDVETEALRVWALAAEQAGRTHEARQRGARALELTRRLGPPQQVAAMEELLERLG